MLIDGRPRNLDVGLITMSRVLSFLHSSSITPSPLMCGLNMLTFGLDNSNISYVILSIILYPSIYSIIRPESKSMNFSYVMLMVLFIISVCFMVMNLFLYFLFYESLTLPIFLLLFIYIPSYYRIRTSFFFFIFTIFGTIGFILGLLIMITPNLYLTFLIIIPFFIKIPTFPFIVWLPEVHRESSTSIPLFLAGLLLKLSVYGILRFILSSFSLTLRYITSITISISIISIITSTFSCFRYSDSKKIIASLQFYI